MERVTKVTVQGLKKLEDELEYLKTEKRKEMSEQIKVARSFGDLSPLLKSVISHRARAIRRFIAAAPRYLSDRT